MVSIKVSVEGLTLLRLEGEDLLLERREEPLVREERVDPLVREDPLEREERVELRCLEDSVLLLLLDLDTLRECLL